jgi:hypothetical protein
MAEELVAVLHTETPNVVLTKRQRFQVQYKKVIRRYRPGYYSGDVKLILSGELAETSVVKEWQKVVGGKVDVVVFPGKHMVVYWQHAVEAATHFRRLYKEACAAHMQTARPD